MSADNEGFWIDNASTTMQLESGNVDEACKVWEMHSEFVHPMSGQLIKRRTVISLIDADHNRYEQFLTISDDQPEMKSMEINYARK